jgi:peptidoglycan hydrolase CwlO-like protein
MRGRYEQLSEEHTELMSTKNTMQAKLTNEIDMKMKKILTTEEALSKTTSSLEKLKASSTQQVASLENQMKDLNQKRKATVKEMQQ